MLDVQWAKQLLGYFNPKMVHTGGVPRELTRKERKHRKSRNKMARDSRRRNRR